MAARRKAKPAGPKKITEEDVKAAVDVISSEYWQEVRECAQDFIERFNKGEFRDEEDYREQLEQYVDGSQRVIYTYWARLGLLATNSAEAYEEETGEVPAGDSAGISRQMYFAFRQDILNNIGSDIDFDEGGPKHRRRI
jgi:hypothetical protein